MHTYHDKPRQLGALLTAPKTVPCADKIRQVFQDCNHVKAITRITASSSQVTVRTNIQTVGIIDIAVVAERLAATDVVLAFSRGGLVFTFKY